MRTDTLIDMLGDAAVATDELSTARGRLEDGLLEIYGEENLQELADLTTDAIDEAERAERLFTEISQNLLRLARDSDDAAEIFESLSPRAKAALEWIEDAVV